MSSQENGQVPVKIVGIDASLTSTGIAILHCGNEPITTAVKNSLTGTSRLIYVRDYVKQVIEGADLAVIEGYAFSKGDFAHAKGELGGVLRLMIVDSGMKLLEVTPNQLKKFAVGDHNASKEKVAVGVYKRWGKEFKENDETDAYILAEIGRAYLGLEDKLTAYQQEVIDALRGIEPPKKKRKKKGE